MTEKGSMNGQAPNNSACRPCNLCGSRSTVPLYPKLGMIKCLDCGLVRAEHIPPREELERLYSERYFHSTDSGALGYDDYGADRAKISETFDRRMGEIEQWLGHKGSLLDVGCAMGFSLDVACRRGWQAQGIEISRFACDYARNDLGVDVSCGSLEEIDLEPESFDVITMWDYIEHSPDPAGEFQRAHRLLKRGGMLVLTTPNIASLPARIWGPRWMGIKQEEHLYYFSPATINRFLSAHRFRTVYVNHVGKYIDVDFFIKRTGLYSKKVERALGWLSGVLGIGGSMVYVNPFDIIMVYAKKLDTFE